MAIVPAISNGGSVYTGPSADGTNGQVLQTNGSGVTSWATASSGISDVVSDTTPQLGGDLDVNGNDLVSVSNGDITITPNGTGEILMTNAVANDGMLTVRGSGGVSGTDELQFGHLLSSAYINVQDSANLNVQFGGATQYRVGSGGWSFGNYSNTTRADIRSNHLAITAMNVRGATSSSVDTVKIETPAGVKRSGFDKNGNLLMVAISADPADPPSGEAVFWVSDGTGSGDDGDIMCKSNNGSSTSTITIGNHT